MIMAAVSRVTPVRRLSGQCRDVQPIAARISLVHRDNKRKSDFAANGNRDLFGGATSMEVAASTPTGFSVKIP
jgi:hypothetical protein